MPPPATVETYVELIGKTGLIPEDRLTESLSKINGRTNPPRTIDTFAQACIAEGLLTTFQSKQIRLGRYKKFVLNGKYRILELIGTGGMGAVYLCEHKFMRRLVAVKILPADKYADPSNLERFIREARAVAALNHPNIVRAYDIDKAEGMHFLVMEYVDGASLQEIVARYGPLDPIRAAYCIAQGAVGLQHALEMGLIHRDVKPGNLLIDRTGIVKLLDLGLARFFEPERDDKLTERYDEKCVLGTADYLAPEQAISNNVDIRADIYGLGGTFYFLLTGRSPAPDGNVAQKLLFHQRNEPVPVTHFRKDVPPGILAVLAKMLKKNPADRYQLPLDVAAALAEWAEQPIPIPPEYEMPDLCPAVVSLVGHSLDRHRATGTSAGSGSVRFVLPRAKSGVGSKASSGVALATAASSSQVDFRPPRTEQGSTLPNATAHSPTTPLPKNAIEPVRPDGDSSSDSLPGLVHSDLDFHSNRADSRKPFRIRSPKSQRLAKASFWAFAGVLAVAASVLGIVWYFGR